MVIGTVIDAFFSDVVNKWREAAESAGKEGADELFMTEAEETRVGELFLEAATAALRTEWSGNRWLLHSYDQMQVKMDDMREHIGRLVGPAAQTYLVQFLDACERNVALPEKARCLRETFDAEQLAKDWIAEVTGATGWLGLRTPERGELLDAVLLNASLPDVVRAQAALDEAWRAAYARDQCALLAQRARLAREEIDRRCLAGRG